MYYQITSDVDYYDLVKEKRRIIAGGLKNSMCITQAVITNTLNDVDVLCRSYGLKYGMMTFATI